jgi:hypothetical protein
LPQEPQGFRRIAEHDSNVDQAGAARPGPLRVSSPRCGPLRGEPTSRPDGGAEPEPPVVCAGKLPASSAQRLLCPAPSAQPSRGDILATDPRRPSLLEGRVRGTFPWPGTLPRPSDRPILRASTTGGCHAPNHPCRCCNHRERPTSLGVGIGRVRRSPQRPQSARRHRRLRARWHVRLHRQLGEHRGDNLGPRLHHR